MNIQELERILIQNQIPTNMYSLTGGLPSDSFCIEKTGSLWHIYYSERGTKWTIGLFDDENNATDALLKEIRRDYPHLSINPDFWRGDHRELDEKWIREHLPGGCRNESIDWFGGLYLDGFKVMVEGDRGEPGYVLYEAKDEEDLRWWQLDKICYYVGKEDISKIWRWHRDYIENGQWYFIEHRHYDYDAIEDSRLPSFERYLRNVKHSFPEDYFRKKVTEYTGLMNRWFLTPHWGYDFENLCFIEISPSREYCSDFDKSEEIKDYNVIRVVD